MDIVAFGALIKRKRGEAKLSQEKLAGRIYNDPARKSDISRLERGLIANPQEKTIQYLCEALNISIAEMEPLRQSRPSAAQLDNIPSLSREALQNLAARFNIDGSFTLPDEELRRLLTLKAEEHRALLTEIESLKGLSARIDNIHAAALDAAENNNYAEANQLLEDAREINLTENVTPALETNAKLLKARADIALLNGEIGGAYGILSTAADSFAAIAPDAPARKRLEYNYLLYSHGLRYGSTGMMQAATMSRDAIDLLDREKQSGLWAHAQNDLAAALEAEGSRIKGTDGADFLAEAVTAYRAALEVCTRADQPENWAVTQNNLAIALSNQGIRTQGEEAAVLLAGAVTAFRNALEVHTRADRPVYWATTQNNLGGVLQLQGTHTEGAEGEALLAEAVTAHGNALEVENCADHPVQWARTQNNLASALQQQGIRTEGASGAELLAKAVTAFRKALEVYTHAEHPVQWAMIEENIAMCEMARAKHDSCPDPRPPLTAALEAVDKALSVYDPDHMSYYHTKATHLRAQIQAALDTLPPA